MPGCLTQHKTQPKINMVLSFTHNYCAGTSNKTQNILISAPRKRNRVRTPPTDRSRRQYWSLEKITLLRIIRSETLLTYTRTHRSYTYTYYVLLAMRMLQFHVWYVCVCCWPRVRLRHCCLSDAKLTCRLSTFFHLIAPPGSDRADKTRKIIDRKT